MAAAIEGKLQAQIIRWLKSQGAYVIKTKPQPGTPTGCPDILFLFEGAWAVIEVKATPRSRFQPGQQLTLQRLRDWSPFVYVAYPENWDDVKAELSRLFF